MSHLLRQRIGIVGAGLPGLATAHALHQLGFRHIAIFDAASSFASAAPALHSGGVVLSANGVRVLDRLGLSAPLYKFGQQIHAVSNLSHAGHHLSGYSPSALVGARAQSAGAEPGGDAKPYKLTSIALHGRHLYDALASTLPAGVRVHWNAPLVRVERAQADDAEGALSLRAGDGGGLQYDADVLVGDDGIHSRLRSEFFAAEARGRGVEAVDGGVYVRGLAPASALRPDARPVDRAELVEVWGNGCKLSYAFVDERTVMWLATLSAGAARALPEDAQDPRTLAALARVFASLPPYVAQLVSAADASSVGRAPVEQLEPAGVLHDPASTRMALVGAAAHSPVQEQWQGLAQGLEDAAVLATLLGATERAAALQRYSSLRVPRASFVGRLAADEARQALKSGRIMSAFRDMATSIMPPAATRDSAKQLLAYDAVKDAQGQA